MPEVWIWILIVVLFMLAYAGLVLPILPDYPLLLVGFIVYHFALNNQAMGWFFWVSAGFIAILMFLIDYIASSVAVKQKGGSHWSIVAAVVGIISFPFFMGPLGIIVGPFTLVFLVEYAFRRDTKESLEIAYSTLIGFLGGVVVKFLIMTGMIAWFTILVVMAS